MSRELEVSLHDCDRVSLVAHEKRISEVQFIPTTSYHTIIQMVSFPPSISNHPIQPFPYRMDAVVYRYIPQCCERD